MVLSEHEMIISANDLKMGQNKSSTRHIMLMTLQVVQVFAHFCKFLQQFYFISPRHLLLFYFARGRNTF